MVELVRAGLALEPVRSHELQLEVIRVVHLRPDRPGKTWFADGRLDRRLRDRGVPESRRAARIGEGAVRTTVRWNTGGCDLTASGRTGEQYGRERDVSRRHSATRSCGHLLRPAPEEPH